MDTELTLRDYIAIFRHRWWVIALVTASCLGLTLIWSAIQTPMYRSSATVLINQENSSALFDPVSSPFGYAERLAENEARFLESELVATEAINRLGYEAEVAVSTDDSADVLTVVGVSADPAASQEIAETFAEAYIDVRQNQFVSERLDTANALVDRMEELDEQIGAATDENRLRLQLLRDELADSFDRLLITADLASSTGSQILDRAQLPAAPYAPRTNRNLALGAVLGVMAGIGAALLVESLDRSVKTREVLEEASPGIPVLALIPSLQSSSGVVAMDNPGGTEAEAFRSLRAALEFAEVDRKIRVIQVTSASASAGKTTVAANLAAVMAQSGHMVVVIDADLRRPRLHSVFGVGQVPGLTSIILGRQSFADVGQVLQIENGGLKVIPSGPIPPGPSELLGSERASLTFANLRELADVIIVDSPPVLPVADALVLSRYADATVLVANARLTDRDALGRALEKLRQAGAPVVGTVLNQVARRGLSDYGYGYGASYGQDRTARLLKRGATSRIPSHAGTEEFASDGFPRFEAAGAVPEDARADRSQAGGNGSRTTTPHAPAAVGNLDRSPVNGAAESSRKEPIRSAWVPSDDAAARSSDASRRAVSRAAFASSIAEPPERSVQNPTPPAPAVVSHPDTAQGPSEPSYIWGDDVLGHS